MPAFLDADNLAPAVGEARNPTIAVKAARSAARNLVRQIEPGHADHVLQARNGIAWVVGVNGGQRTFVAGIHRLHHIHRFRAADLANHDPVRPHPQGVANQCPLVDFTLAFDVRRARFQADDMRLLELQLGCVFDGDDALGLRNESGQYVEQRGLAGTRAAGNKHVDLRLGQASSIKAISGVSDL